MPPPRRLPQDRAPRIARPGAILGAAIGVVAILAGCATTVNGQPSGASSTPAASGSSGAGPASSASSDPASGAASTAAPAGFLCPGSTVVPVATCLEAALSDFWSAQLNQVVHQPVVLAPTPSQVPADCRGGIDLGTAFTCPTDGRLYVTSTFLSLLADNFAAEDLGYALAGLQAHEMGHVVQYAVKQPGTEIQNPTSAQSRVFEQQADCLAGVWAFHAAAEGDLNAAHFESIDSSLISLISNNAEISTHGTPPDRATAILRGAAAGRPQDCQLVSFH